MSDRRRDEGATTDTVGEEAQPTIERITVSLINKANDDLRILQDRTGLSKTDLVNRAITLYEFISRQMDTGHEVLIRDSESSETQVLRLL